ncbi:MAG TPA: choice-of-anchor J domain-containing protein [Ferruginibacter sp.]|nr:choice-of-anchor J domain-containing protein [Ferruginibacter sp.]HPH89555.1 choice-of-anchor J domain-containing protein [Ferruginibacter sp.]
MSNKILRNLLACLGLSAVLFQSCKDDSKLTVPVPPADASFSESFDDFGQALEKGWVNINKSFPLGPILYDVAEAPNFGSPNYVSIYYPKWEQAQLTLDPAQFPTAPYPNRIWKEAYQSFTAANGYAATSQANSLVWSSGHTVNSWLVSPQLNIKNGDKISFYTYSNGDASLELYINPKGTTNVGDGDVANSGDFISQSLVTIPNKATNPHAVYPREWTKFEATVTGLGAPVNGRFGFRYLRQNQPAFRFSTADPNDLDTIFTQVHRTIIGIDEVSFQSAQ